MIFLAARILLGTGRGKGCIIELLGGGTCKEGDTDEFEEKGRECQQDWFDGPTERICRGTYGCDQRAEGDAEVVLLGLKRIELVVEACTNPGWVIGRLVLA